MRVGVDLGGTKTEAILMDDRGEIVERVRKPTPRGKYEDIVSLVADLYRQLKSTCIAQNLSAPSLGVGIPGSISPISGKARNANTTELNGRGFLSDLKTLLGMSQLRVENDANCFALSEATDGAGASSHVVFAVILGTGVGSGITVGGKLLSGHNGIGGEWGHNSLPWKRAEDCHDRICYCGKSDCVETYLSGPALADSYNRLMEPTSYSKVKTAHDVSVLAADGDAKAHRVMTAYEDQLARGLAQIVNILDPDVIVLGGGLSNIDRLYETVPNIMSQYVFADEASVDIRPPKYGDSSGVRGAAWLGAIEKVNF